MRQFMTGLILAASLASGPAPAQDGPVEGVIQRQLDAFRQGDLDAAFAFASPSIQRIFGSPSNFGAMVENGYPMVYRPSEVRYLEQRPFGEGVIQTVLMRDAAGVPWVLAYQMIEGPDGWLIDGVEILRANEMGA